MATRPRRGDCGRRAPGPRPRLDHGNQNLRKGLVQTVYPLSENTGLALTTAHFYTPSGRLIQRDYTNKSFYDYYFHKGDDTKNPLDVKMTEGGRTVYGGGGITPDEKFEAAKLDRLELELGRAGLFNFTRSYFGSHSTTMPKGWMPDTALVEEFHDYLLKHGTTFTEPEFIQDREWITRYLAREMYITAFNIDESDRVFAQTDPEVAKAVDAMPKANALLESTKKDHRRAHERPAFRCSPVTVAPAVLPPVFLLGPNKTHRRQNRRRYVTIEVGSHSTIIVLDAGGQYCHLIARKVRDLGVYAEVRPSETPAAAIASARGIIISGGPASVYDPGSPTVDAPSLPAGRPYLGICYGQQLMAHLLGARFAGREGRVGLATLELDETADRCSPGSAAASKSG